MIAMLRCPSCNDIITSNSTQCKYCSEPLDQNTIKTEVEKFEHVSSAVSQANTIQAFNAGLIVVGILCVYLVVTGMSGLSRAYLHVFPYGMFVWVLTWFFRFGRLKSKDPELEPARVGVKRSLLMWAIGALVYTICLGWVLVSFLNHPNQQHNLFGH